MWTRRRPCGCHGGYRRGGSGFLEDQLTPGRFVLLRGEWNIGDPLPGPSNATGMRTAGTSGRRRRVVDHERGGGKATSTLKQEDWNKRLAWPREGKARAGPEVEKKRRRNRWGRGSVCGCWYGAQSCFAHHLPSSRTQPPFEAAVRGPSSGSFAPAVSSTLTCFSSSHFSIFLLYLHFYHLLLLLLVLIFLLLLDPRPTSPTVRQHSDVVCLDVPLLCSRRWLDNFADVICDLMSRNMHRGQLVPCQTRKLISL